MRNRLLKGKRVFAAILSLTVINSIHAQEMAAAPQLYWVFFFEINSLDLTVESRERMDNLIAQVELLNQMSQAQNSVEEAMEQEEPAATEPSVDVVDGSPSTMPDRDVAGYTVVGHAAPIGNPAGVIAMSEKRATLVAELLMEAGVSREMITSRGVGAEESLSIETESGSREEASFRRYVEVYIGDVAKPVQFSMGNALATPDMIRNEWVFHFEINSLDLTAESRLLMRDLVAQAQKEAMAMDEAVVSEDMPLVEEEAAAETVDSEVDIPSKYYTVIGHAAAIGNPVGVVTRSEERAGMIAQILMDAGLPEESINWRGAGSQEPVGDVKTRAGASANRRVHVTISLTSPEIASPLEADTESPAN